MRPEEKGKLIGLLIGFFIALGFTIFTVLKMIELVSIQQDISGNTGTPIYDPFILMFILISLVPTLYLLGEIIKLLSKNVKA